MCFEGFEVTASDRGMTHTRNVLNRGADIPTMLAAQNLPDHDHNRGVLRERRTGEVVGEEDVQPPSKVTSTQRNPSRGQQ